MIRKQFLEQFEKHVVLAIKECRFPKELILHNIDIGCCPFDNYGYPDDKYIIVECVNCAWNYVGCWKYTKMYIWKKKFREQSKYFEKYKFVIPENLKKQMIRIVKKCYSER